MAKLDKRPREALVKALQEGVAPPWTVTSGVQPAAYIEIDEDGERPDTRFPDIGTIVLSMTNDAEGVLLVYHRRVRCPPGYTEARRPIRTIACDSGVGWKERLVAAALEAVDQVDAVREQGKKP